MNKNLVKTLGMGALGAVLYITPAQAGNVCIAGNFDGNVAKAQQTFDRCEGIGANAYVLMGNYGSAGTIEPFAKSGKPVYALLGGNDGTFVDEVKSKYNNVNTMKNSQPVNVAGLKMIPLNGDVNSSMFDFNLVSNQEFVQYLKTLSENKDAIAVSRISPYGNVDVVLSPKDLSSQEVEKIKYEANKVPVWDKDEYLESKLNNREYIGNKTLEDALSLNGMNSISAQTNYTGAAMVGGEWRVNPGNDYALISTNEGEKPTFALVKYR